MSTIDFNKKLLKHFPFDPTGDQEKLIVRMSEFLNDKIQRKTFILKGYAGTGKTTFIKSLVKTLPECSFSIALLAPTGRAAKVMSEYSGVPAMTIHKAIYEINTGKGASMSVRLGQNKEENKIFIVDEASMISYNSDNTFIKGRNLLEDLFTHVYSTRGCSIIFIGDTAQLPPVGENNSVALDEKFIERDFNTKVYSVVLKDVMRHAQDSGILMNATALRVLIGQAASEPILKSLGFSDIGQLYSEDITESMEKYYSGRKSEETLVVCRSNKQANKYNLFIRQRFLGFEEVLCSGDRLMVVKNNYFWLEKESSAGFIANGDVIRIRRLHHTEEKFGFKFADATVEMVDYAGEKVEVKLLLDTISSETPSLNQEDYKKLFDEVYNSFDKDMKQHARLKKTLSDPYVNALQVKFSYAVTCHKAQGGQWPTVFVDPGYMNEKMYNTEYLRWLYTAITRATTKLMFVNFDDRFFRK